ncbi:hypothetical protein SALBM311S_11456 [Streptomyces alboniger]
MTTGTAPSPQALALAVKETQEMAKQEDVIGRANVGDSPELEAYYGRLEKLGAGALGLWRTR